MRKILLINLLGLVLSNFGFADTFAAVKCLRGDQFGNYSVLEVFTELNQVQFLGNGNLAVIGKLVNFRTSFDPNLEKNCRSTYEQCYYLPSGPGSLTRKCFQESRRWNVLTPFKTTSTIYVTCAAGSNILFSKSDKEVIDQIYQNHYGTKEKNTISDPKCLGSIHSEVP